MDATEGDFCIDVDVILGIVQNLLLYVFKERSTPA